MSVSGTEADAMRRAITISALGLGSTSPNPPVGCVILDRAGRPVGEGYHRRKGEPHAEVKALTAAGARAAGGTAVVTLEPCNHHGRTPPCHQALIDASVSRVLIAVIDPTSRGEGGAARLRQAGIEVEVGVLADEALVVLGPWLQALKSGRPFVVWAYEARADGPRALPAEVLAHAGLRFGVDAVLRADGRIEEGRPGVHGADSFALPDSVLTAEPADALAELYAGGVRSLLLNGGPEFAEQFLARQLVDDLAVFLGAPADRPVPPLPSTTGTRDVMPRAFRIRSVTRLGTGALLRAERDKVR
ncbi:bifunctional diaminohydroxyphosphoribosylaminopyrimidine deaminase/5-amino-6-(5-phosphoribosylamino)uracil reductase RibD [Pseudonocardia nigra]|uniref:bifunctional diaminohydroxyphosphoribosylaminopyrimidine deaminase/5-amino-6-(5-phosphoribosylamino)uracil reductase RibD n=1 Tax=Pseudonocardia nigra TaxID=1921578 RepID=UPI001C5CED0E|nr:bifunctional diaminohydroxyphosphoribosylaminopyrimidine deaminase/5-amino-6-(5-phosphoribosylamino)uracil reductase RibD [Pseudonocardia nigra]